MARGASLSLNPEEDPVTTAVAPDSTKRLYHVGLAKDCPVDIVTAGGIALCKMTETISFDRHKNSKRTERVGDTFPLTTDEVERVRAAVARLAIRASKSEHGKPVYTVVRVGEKVEHVRDKVDVDPKTGIQTTTPIYESRRQAVYDKATDQPLGPWVYLRQVEAPPGETTPDERMGLPDWAQPKPEAPAKAPTKK